MSTRPMECGTCGKDHPSSNPCPTPKKLWEHTGGGTFLGGKSKFASDDDYENIKTGERILIRCTPDRHFNLPDWVRRPSDLTRLTGVSKRVKRLRPPRKS